MLRPPSFCVSGIFTIPDWQSRSAVKRSLSLMNAAAQPATFTPEVTFETHPDFLWFPHWLPAALWCRVPL
jgi:hypothetical protein